MKKKNHKITLTFKMDRPIDENILLAWLDCKLAFIEDFQQDYRETGGKIISLQIGKKSNCKDEVMTDDLIRQFFPNAKIVR